MDVIRSPHDMTARSRDFLREGRTIGFVPTMGALHEGHLSLVDRSTTENDATVVSIFVNPTQFRPSEDFEAYPRDLEGDLDVLRKYGVSIVFAPGKEDLYPDRYETYVHVENLTKGMCGASRPGHFMGVTTIVTKLFHIVLPSQAYFGQKDYQQAVVIKTMVRDLNMDIDVQICPIIREDDGLAMSSRNIYLTDEERRAAAVIYRSLTHVSERLRNEGLSPGDAGHELRKLLSAEPLVREIQYAGAYDPDTLEEVLRESTYSELLLATALFIGHTRLIDNMIVGV